MNGAALLALALVTLAPKPRPRPMRPGPTSVTAPAMSYVMPVAMPPLPDTWEILDFATAPVDAAGFHDDAFDAAKLGILGAHSADPAVARPARKGLYIGRGDWRLRRPASVHFQSIPSLQIRGDGPGSYKAGDGTRIELKGRDTIVHIDGCMFGSLRGVTIMGANAQNAADLPMDLLRIDKTLPQGVGPVQTGFTVDDVALDGQWQAAAYRAGTLGWNDNQQDNFIVGDLTIRGRYDPSQIDQSDRCRHAAYFGAGAWGNNRAHHVKHLYALGGRQAVVMEKTGVQIDYLAAWNARDVIAFGGEVGKVVIAGGEAETCQRFVMDYLGFPNQHALAVRDFWAKLDAYRDMGGVADGERADWQNVFGFWQSGGDLLLDNVTVSHIGAQASGPLTVKPKFVSHDVWTTRLRTRSAAVWGHTLEEAFEPRGYSQFTHDDWRDCAADGVVTGIRDGRVVQRGPLVRAA